MKKLLLLSLLVGCATGGSSRPPVVSSLTVINETGLAVDVYFDGSKVGTVMKMKECLPLRAGGRGVPVGRLRFEVTSEQPFETPVVDLRSSWSIRLGPSPHSRNFDALSLVQAPNCMARTDGYETIRRTGDQPA